MMKQIMKGILAFTVTAALGLTAVVSNAQDVVSDEAQARVYARQLMFGSMCNKHIRIKPGYERQILLDKVNALTNGNPGVMFSARAAAEQMGISLRQHANRVGKGNLDDKVINATCGKFLVDTPELNEAYEIRPLGVDA